MEELGVRKCISAKHLHRGLKPLTFGGQWRVAAFLEGSIYAWVREWVGRAGYGQPWGYRGHQIPVQEKGYYDIGICGFLLEHLRLPDHPRNSPVHKPVHIGFPLSILFPP